MSFLLHRWCIFLALMAPAVWLTAGDTATVDYYIPAPATGVQTSAYLGYSVAIDGAFAVAGVPFDNTGETASGVVKVFDSTTGALLHVIPNPQPNSGALFGYAVALSGSQLVVGAYRDNTGAAAAGRAYVFDLTSETPTVPVATLNNPEPAANDGFGIAVAISGTRLVIGAFGDSFAAQSAGSAYVYDLTSPTPTVPVLTLRNPSPAANDNFGYSVGISGVRVVIGARLDDTGATDTGSAYIYDLTSGTPDVPVFTLNNPSPGANDGFGFAVGISGRRIVVGAYADSTSGQAAGIAYVYDLANANPTTPILTLNNPEPPTTQDQFGFSVGISGTRIVVGAIYGDNGVDGAGSAYVYDLGSATPNVPAVTLNNPDPTVSDAFGMSVRISGSRVIVGAYADDTAGDGTGSAYVFDLDSAAPGTALLTLNDAGFNSGAQFGTAVALSGTHLVVGAPLDDTGADRAGSAYVFDLASATPATPVLTLHNPAPQANDYFGQAVAASGTRIAVAAPFDSGYVGSVYVYDLAGADPATPVVTLTNPEIGGQRFGNSVAMAGSWLVVGAPSNSPGASRAGTVYVYDLAGATPTQPIFTLPNPDPGNSEFFGWSVAISGARVAVGAYYDSSAAGAFTGSAYVYDLSGTAPEVPVVALNNPEPASGDLFGYSVAIDGTRVVVGAYGDDAGAPDAGSAYVYDILGATPTTPVAILHNPAPAPSDEFGYSVAIVGTRIVVGVIADDSGGDAGSAFVYDLTSATPTVPVATLNNPAPGRFDEFGACVAMDGNTLAIGVPFDDSPLADNGSVYVYTVDTTAPETVITSGPPARANSTSASIAFTGSDDLTPTASLAYEGRLDGANFAPVTSPLTLVGLSDGPHTFEVRAIDGAGNADPTPASVAWVVDTVAPLVAPPLPPQRQIAGPTGTAVLADYTGAVLALASEPATAVQTPAPGTVLKLGTYLLTFVITDPAGNMSETQAALTVAFARPAVATPVLLQASDTDAPIGAPPNAKFGRFFAPAISDFRDVVARVTMTSGTRKFAGIYLEDGAGAASLPVFQGAPSGVAGVTFKSFGDPVIAPGGAIAFAAKLQGAGVTAANDDTVWTTLFDGTLQLALHEGSGFDALDGAVIKSVLGISVEDGGLLSLVTLSGLGVTKSNDRALLLQTSADSATVLMRTSAAPQLILPVGRGTTSFNAKTITALAPATGSPGHGRWHGKAVVARMTGTLNGIPEQMLIARFPAAGGTETIVQTGATPPPGAPVAARWATFSLPAINPVGTDIAVQGKLQLGAGNVTISDDTLLVHFGPNGAAKIARENEPLALPGAPAWNSFADPIVNDAGTVAFQATLKGAGVTKANRSGLWAGLPAQLTLLARLGDPAPNADGVLTNAKWSGFTSYALPSGENAGAILIAKVAGAEVAKGKNTGVWAVCSDGIMREVLKQGDSIGGKPVKTFTLLGPIRGAYGVARSYNATGSLALKVTFTDQTQAVVRLDLP